MSGPGRNIENSSLLHLLQAVFKYEFDDEYKDLAKILKQQFKDEKQFAEHEASQSLQDYVDSFFEAQKRKAKEGLASSFKVRLQQILDQMATAERESSEPPANDAESERQKKLNGSSICQNASLPLMICWPWPANSAFNCPSTCC